MFSYWAQWHLCCNLPGLVQESLGPEVSWECPSGCLWGPSRPHAPEYPKSVPRVSPECQKGGRTLRGHSRDTFWTRWSPRPEGPQRHPEGHSRDTLGPKGPRDSCSRSGGRNICVIISGLMVQLLFLDRSPGGGIQSLFWGQHFGRGSAVRVGTAASRALHCSHGIPYLQSFHKILRVSRRVM